MSQRPPPLPGKRIRLRPVGAPPRGRKEPTVRVRRNRRSFAEALVEVAFWVSILLFALVVLLELTEKLTR